MTTDTYSLKWDLDVFFTGGSSSPQFYEHMDSLEKNLSDFERKIEGWDIPKSEYEVEPFLEIIHNFQLVGIKMRQAGAFVSCLQAQDTSDKKAVELRGKVSVLSSKFQTALTNLDDKLKKINDQTWKALLEQEQLEELSFILNERREEAAKKLPREQEALINALSVDGYHGWGEMYDTIVSKIRIPFDGKELSVGQSANKFSDRERHVRKEVFENWETAWGEQAEYLANTLNHLAGFRLSVYKQRGWDEVLQEPLSYNRMKKETLDAMWGAIADLKEPFVQFLERKAKLLGVDKLSWFDLDAPVGEADSSYSYQEGAEFITNQFSQFGENLAEFTKNAFEQRWIEAEDRPGKRPGGFCTYFPESKQSRIFMTYSGTPSNVSTLAHELGHAFHSYALKDTHPLNRNYAMNVAETASTFAEMIVSDASVKEAKSKDERISLLEDKIQRSIALLMNIHARFLFETRFYEERKEGLVSLQRLNELMEEAQKQAYGNSLEQYHPLFWASKLHFFITGVPFYNFPYTFGFLFSLGIYAKALEEGKGYEGKYMALLRDTGSMSVEDLAEKHLNVDLTKREFWENGLKLCVEDVNEFLRLTE
ncbi:M3 family oligoendopeptidase [Falsibacillus albus]|uniref:M3 family oligoendopeptidase n=1 Tax=Falsibacillus albus TaxID=2478915 RepID=A0A3L7K4Z3_9BACI|nr:M3 family oligoendopeptidase [Falsibacillus albus]RLQ98143.1 M3 family oligoendopeptidase [Falsibacillus albus]